MSDLINRQAAIDIERNATVDTNPSHFEAHQKFTQFMDDAEVSSFGRWQWSNGFNTALTAVGIDLKKLPSAHPDVPDINVGDMISRHAALDAIHCNITVTGRQNAELVAATIGAFADRIKALPTIQPDEKLEKCRFEYINACRTVTYPTPDTTKKDISDAYAVIKVLQPIFGDVTF